MPGNKTVSHSQTPARLWLCETRNKSLSTRFSSNIILATSARTIQILWVSKALHKLKFNLKSVLFRILLGFCRNEITNLSTGTLYLTWDTYFSGCMTPFSPVGSLTCLRTVLGSIIYIFGSLHSIWSAPYGVCDLTNQVSGH